MAPREKSLGAVVVSSLVEILARSAPRSERDPDLEATTAKLAMHPVTGTFADPALELAFAAQLFRTAYPFHAFLMALLAAYTWIALTTLPDRRGFFVTIALLTALGLLGRTLLHRMENSVGAQRIGSWTWTAIVVLGGSVEIAGCIIEPGVSWAAVAGLYRIGLQLVMVLAFAVTNGSLGMSFAHKFALAVPMSSIVKLAVCDDGRTLTAVLCEIAALNAGSVAVHMLELYLRSSYVERVEEKRRLEVRMEQLQAEKERLLYDLQRRGRPLDDDNRNAIRRGLQGPNPREAGAPTPSESPLPSLPPGAPSSTADSSSTALRPETEGAGGQRSCVETEASPPVSDAGSMSEVEEALLDLLGDEKVVLELLPPAQANPDNVAVVRPREIAHGLQEAVDSRPAEPHLPAAEPLLPVDPSYCQLPERLDQGQDIKVFRMQAVHVARQSLQNTRDGEEICKILRHLCLALGSTRTESGTIKAVHAALLNLDQPMAERDAAALTGASLSNFKKWRKRVQHAQLGLPPP